MSKKKEVTTETTVVAVTPNSVEWTDYILSLLNDDEKINGNPTTDGLRRIFETALNCTIISSTSNVVQTPSPENERRATVVHSLVYVLKDQPVPSSIPEISYSGKEYTVTISGSADVYWGNCDKIFRNHPVAVAETRAEGRALRRALRLRKVLAAEELSNEIDTDHLEGNNINKINTTQINFLEVFGKRLNINIHKLSGELDIDSKNIYDISYDNAIKLISQLTNYQQSGQIPENIIGYDPNWK